MSTKHPISSLSDRELMDQTSAGDQAAFKELYSRYQVSIYNYVLRLTNQSTAAEDLLQEIFLAIWQGARKFRGESSPKTWMFRIAHYQTASWLRKQKKWHHTVENLDTFDPPSDAPSPEDDFIGEWQSAQIRQAIEHLAPHHRAVIELTFMHDFAYREIAKIMSCPIGTVKSRMSYALKYLNAMLSAQDEDPRK